MSSLELGSTATLRRRRVEYARGFAILAVGAVVGLLWAKWQPYAARTLTILASHAYPGSSIVSGAGETPPPPSWDAAVGYARSYFLAIWQALLVGLLLAATVETLVPRDAVARVLGGAGAKAAALGGLLSLPGMMCTCCTAPVVVGLRRSGASAGTAAAFFLGNPTLNPAVLVFLLLAMGWQWAVLRALFGVVLVAVGAYVATRLSGDRLVLAQPSLEVTLPAERPGLAVRWLRSLARLVIALAPEYVVIVLLLGAFRALLFPAAVAHAGNDIGAMALMAVAGTLFVIPTAGEIPIIQTLMSFGLGSGVAGVLLLTLAPVSLPSLVMLGRSFPPRVIVALAALTALTGVLSGLAVVTLGI